MNRSIYLCSLTHILFRPLKFVRDRYFWKSIFMQNITLVSVSHHARQAFKTLLVFHKALNLEICFRRNFAYRIWTFSGQLFCRRHTNWRSNCNLSTSHKYTSQKYYAWKGNPRERPVKQFNFIEPLIFVRLVTLVVLTCTGFQP